jgi:hypothetical protein
LWCDLPSSSQQPIYQSISAAQFPRKEPEPPPRAPPRVQVLGGPPTDDKKGRPLSPGRIIPAPTKVDMSMYTVNTHDQYGGKFAGPGVNQVHCYPEETTDFTQLAPSGAGLTQDYLEVKAAVKAERAASPKQERPRSANRVVPFPMLENPFDKSIYQTNTHSMYGGRYADKPSLRPKEMPPSPKPKEPAMNSTIGCSPARRRSPSPPKSLRTAGASIMSNPPPHLNPASPVAICFHKPVPGVICRVFFLLLFLLLRALSFVLFFHQQAPKISTGYEATGVWTKWRTRELVGQWEKVVDR